MLKRRDTKRARALLGTASSFQCRRNSSALRFTGCFALTDFSVAIAISSPFGIVRYTQPVADLSKDVPGYAELCEFYGEFPSFHDAEIVSVHLNRTGTS